MTATATRDASKELVQRRFAADAWREVADSGSCNIMEMISHYLAKPDTKLTAAQADACHDNAALKAMLLRPPDARPSFRTPNQ